MGAGYCVVVTTVDSEAAAERIVGRALDARLAACAQVFPITSHYVWRGERKRDAELLVQLKTRDDLWDALAAAIREVHPYETPEILKTPITAGDAAYLRWIDDSTA